jgi:hypothetical protein
MKRLSVTAALSLIVACVGCTNIEPTVTQARARISKATGAAEAVSGVISAVTRARASLTMAMVVGEGASEGVGHAGRIVAHTHTLLATAQATEVVEDQRLLAEAFVFAPGMRHRPWARYGQSKARQLSGARRQLEAAVSGYVPGGTLRRLSRAELRRVRRGLPSLPVGWESECGIEDLENPAIGFETPRYYVFAFVAPLYKEMECEATGRVKWRVVRRDNGRGVIWIDLNGCHSVTGPAHFLRVTRGGKTLLMHTSANLCQTEGGGYYEHFFDLTSRGRRVVYRWADVDWVHSLEQTVAGGLFAMPDVMNRRDLVYYWPLDDVYAPYERKWWNEKGELVWSRTLVVRIRGLEYLCENALYGPEGFTLAADIGARRKACPTVLQTCHYDAGKNAISCAYEQLTRTVLESSDMDREAMSTAYDFPEHTAESVLKGRREIRKAGYVFGRGTLKRLKKLESERDW